MTLKEAKEEILKRTLEMIETDESGKKYICPICCNGSDEDEKGLITQDNIHFTCPYKCFEDATILEMVGLKSGINKEDQVVRILAHEMKISIEEEVKDETLEKKQANAAKLARRTKSTDDSEIDYSLFYKESINNVDKCQFLKSNILSKSVQEYFDIGYCESWVHPNTSDEMRKYIVATPRLIVPMTNASYLAISIGNDKNMGKTQRVGEHALFNKETLCDGNEPLFVVYDEMEALSIIECGYDAVAIGGKPELLYEALTANECNRLLIISLGDNEDRQQLVATMESKLGELRQDYIVYNLVSNYKSVGEALVKNKKELEQSIDKAIDKATEFELKRVKEYQASSSNRYYFDNFIKMIFRDKEEPFLTTGFEELDIVLDGGLYKGLYIIEGKSSIGKTSLAMQLADSIVAGNKYTDVLIFSLEISRNELIAKSLSRLTAQALMKKEKPLSNAKTTRDVTLKELYTNEDSEDNKLIKEACKKYGELASHIYIYEGKENMGVMDIREEIEKHIAHTVKARHKVVAIIDYVQIMANLEDKPMTDKQKAYMNIAELKRISRDMKIPIIGISSMSDAEDESSAQSSSDTVIYLHIKDDDNSGCDIEAEMKKNPRNMELKILKNRNGEVLDTIDMVYYPQYSLFKSEEYKK